MPTNQNEFIGQGPSEEQMKNIVESLQKGIGSNNDEKLFKSALAAQTVSGANQIKSTDPDKVKKLRERVDGLMIKSKEFANTRELSLAHTNIQRGFMWLGKVLQSLNVQNPYPESTNVASPVIEERTDQYKGEPIALSTIGDKTAIVKWFRAELDVCIHEVDFGYSNHSAKLAEDAFAEAKMWFGQELNNIRLASE